MTVKSKNGHGPHKPVEDVCDKAPRKTHCWHTNTFGGKSCCWCGTLRHNYQNPPNPMPSNPYWNPNPTWISPNPAWQQYQTWC